MHQSRLPTKREALQRLRETRESAEAAHRAGDRETSRGHVTHAEWLAERIDKGDYDT